MYWKSTCLYSVFCISIAINTYAMRTEIEWFGYGHSYSHNQVGQTNYTEKYADTYALMPPLIQKACKKKPTWTEVKLLLSTIESIRKKKTSNIKPIEKYTKDICSLLYLSPQTEAYVIKACQDIAQGNVIDYTNPHLTYNKEQECAYKREVLQLVPPVIRYICEKRLEYDNYESNKIVKALYKASQSALSDDAEFGLYININDICLQERLSPQTRRLVRDIFKNFNTARAEIYNSDSRLTYNAEMEQQNKMVLINQMPTIIRDVYLKDSANYSHYKLLRKIFSKPKCLQKNSHYTYMQDLFASSSLFVSPQTRIRLFHEFDEMLKGNAIPHHPYNVEEEMHNQNILINQCSPELQTLYKNQRYQYTKKRFLIHAYLLDHPQYVPFFSNANSIYFLPVSLCAWKEEYATYISNNIKEFVHNKNDINRLTREFIVTFSQVNRRSYIDERLTFHIVGVCAQDPIMRQQLRDTLKQNADNLVHATKPYKILDKHYIDQKLYEDLEPACPICLEPFADYMLPLPGSTVGVSHQLVCGHAVCTTCNTQMVKRSCPLCRQEII